MMPWMTKSTPNVTKMLSTSWATRSFPRRASRSSKPPQKQPIEQPVEQHCDGDSQEQRRERTQVQARVEGQRAKGGGDQRLAVGQVHDARHAVLQRQPERDERVHATHHE